MPTPVLAIHGGCGAIPRASLTPETNAAARDALRRALQAGYALLQDGASAVDAVTAAVQVMEDDPVFNAGTGAALNRDGVHELDASLMDGATGRAGAVAGARRIRNPVQVARALAGVSDPLLLIGDAADAWAEAHGFAPVPNTHFTTRARQDALRAMLERETLGTTARATEFEKHGTVGAVALDAHGHLAAATSTGGYTAKPPGRVGDSPIIGAGTWADDRTCAMSGTGKGELFIRVAAGHDLHARLLYAGQTLEHAAQDLIHRTLQGVGAGLCAVDRHGNVVLPYNTEGMYRGFITADTLHVAIHED
ncbi:beta-aspartyl-peptidase (threonine type) [Deinococcus metalli]|uniref:Beta-aspartyl-peptidase (Threonine type) n=1 Tax=Deinococcus metalli TaxID=1141878 RepID=A0A7W8KCD4_9DEIO|nr:isoaspartyl peptidase/L-asparaginase [Deinococcus metalli]MBB5375612.1 beta-aspartyl-peptidase (threonine type) [Deinococcus metalli]GHF38383.1 isoaspartyl peptidase/L-asparaginase [Deinococcus metalli]